SDRAFDAGKSGEVGARLRDLGIDLVPQDGGAITARIDRFVYSSAVEPDTPEMRAARALGIECLPRPALLAEVVNAGRPGVAVAGTSGKSTIVGMVAWLLQESGLPATVLGGAALAAQFGAFAANCHSLLVNARCPEAAALGRRLKAVTYGLAADADAALEVLSVGPARASGILTRDGEALTLDVPQPGLHNLENAAAAATIALELGLEPRAIAATLARFPGVARRFEVIGTTKAGIRVVDDYAHNGEKL